MKNLIIIIVGSIFLTGCEQVSKSVRETFEPVADTTAQLKKNEQIPVSVSSPYNPEVEKQIEEARHLVNTMLEKHTKTHIDTYTEGKNTGFLTNENKLKNAEEALRKLPQYAGKEIKIYYIIHFYDNGSILAMLQHPTNPDYIDNYEYKDGKWSEPRPEQISVRDDIQSRLVPLDKMDFASVAKAADLYSQKIAQIEGAKPLTTIYISIANNKLRWFPASINGSRERYSIELNQNGTLKKFERE
ncbi:hypothetical protein SAMN05421594_2425 [Chryseobacterium oleae]|uniref:Uncharacterized protein n=1 Tax=Chryseobacterium oleae TaxID=491207 RepID=A0A1I4YHM0_CHROL|nr:hypothetical protein [Chryseobacterium oleae]SFN37507.1 hypothetical protein SAMN05421594_2425 [Chryseobacterium oleae]